MNWFTADTHFGHRRIIELCRRPFASIEEMDSTLIDNINNTVVAPGDTLWHLGDWSFGRDKTNNAQHYIERINCKTINIIPGNHDPHYKNMLPRKEWADLFSGCFPYYRLKADIDGDPVEAFMFHYACRVWCKSHYGTWNLFGHSHGSLEIPDNSLSMDVGVDANDFRPLSLRDIREKMSAKTFVSITNKFESQADYDRWAKENGH